MDGEPHELELGRWRVLATGVPIEPPLRFEVEGPTGTDVAALATELGQRLNAQFEVIRLDPGSLPVSEHKTPVVHRT